MITALMLIGSTLLDSISRNLNRVDAIWASTQAQVTAGTAFEKALAYIGARCNGGCDHSVAGVLENGDGEEVGTYDFEILGQSGRGSGDYYVPIPGYGDSAEECDDIDNPDDACNWNRIYYGDTVTMPLYVHGDDQFQGSEFFIKIRTPECEDDDGAGNCSDNDRKLIACADGTVSEARNGCSYADDLVVMTWQIVDENEFAEADTSVETFPTTRRKNENSELFTTDINNKLNVEILNIDDHFLGTSNGTIDELIGVEESMTYPILKLSFIQTIENSDGPITYLEYQIVTDEPISSDRSFINTIGYMTHKGETYYWPKEGSYNEYSSSPVNYAFQK